jgi:RNA polymerase sigma-70 factor (ECF subfamily)
MMAMMLDETEASDAELIAQARAGDRAAFGRLVERHYDFVYRVAWRWCGRKADAEDVAQEVCARLGRAIRDYRGGGAFTSWLYALTLNAARDAIRKSVRETVKTEAFGAMR